MKTTLCFDCSLGLCWETHCPFEDDNQSLYDEYYIDNCSDCDKDVCDECLLIRECTNGNDSD